MPLLDLFAKVAAAATARMLWLRGRLPMNPNVLVTGGAGYVGSHTCLRLAEAGFTPVAFDNLSNGHESFVRWGPFEAGDIRSPEQLDAVFARHRPVAVLHFAGLIEVGESFGDPHPFYDNNVAGTLCLLKAMQRAEVARLVFSSTCATYGAPVRVPMAEDHPQAPISPYGRTKLIIEQILADLDRYAGLRSTCLRYFNAAGADLEGRIGERHTPETHAIPLAIKASMGLASGGSATQRADGRMSAAGVPLVIPVILCGGSGTRLWPLSSAGRPKQFLPLIGPRSTFQATVERVQTITGAGPILVVANQDHRALIEDQLAEIGAQALLLLEPCARDSGPAIAAASVWTSERYPQAVAVFVSADHHIVDDRAFSEAIRIAVAAAMEDRIVTLGLRPTSPATEFGYIRPEPSDAAVQTVAAFVEKPDFETAQTYVAAGYLWNSGNFISRPGVLLDELDEHAPALKAAAEAAVAGQITDGQVSLLGEAFASAPKISIDHALMEKTRRASVAPVSFTWSDIGAWNAVLQAAGVDEAGNSLTGAPLVIDSQNCIVRAPPGTRLALIGVRDLAVIVGEDGSLLICDLASSQMVKSAAGHFAKGG